MKALMLLYGLQAKAVLRRLLRGLKTVKGIFIGLFFAGAVSMFGLSFFISSMAGKQASFNGQVYLPFVLFAYFVYSLLSSIGDRSLYFTPSEVEHLFPAPFHRKELLGYKIFTWFVVSVIMSLFLSGAFAVYCNTFLFAFFGMTLTLFFLTLSDMFATLVGQVLSTKIYSTGRKLVALVFLVLLGVGMSQSAMQLGLPELNNIEVWFETVGQSTFGRIVLAPFRVFTNVVFAGSLGSFFLWLGIATAMNAGLIVCILLLDANYLETATGVSQKVYERVERMKAGKIKVSDRSSAWRLKMFPFLRGLGPIAWRQVLSTLRRSQSLMIMGLVLSCGLAVPVVLGIKEDFTRQPLIVAVAFGIMAYLSFILSMNMASGFRADVNFIEVFKSLPAGPFAVASGQLLGPTLLLIAMHAMMTLVGVLATRDFFELWFAGYCFIVLFDILLIATSNALFLLFPVKQGMGTKGVEVVGQNFLIMFFQTLAFCIVGLSVIPAAVIYALTKSVALSLVVVWFVVAFFAVLAIYLCGLAYAKFDVTRIPN